MMGKGRRASGLKRSAGRSRVPVQALVGDFCQPLAHLPVDIVQILELSHGPEALPEIADGAFYLAFFPAAGWIASTREEVVIASETQKSGQEANQASIMFRDGSRQVVIDDFACHSLQCMKRMYVAAGKRFEALAMRELDIEHPAMRVNESERIELANVA